MTELPLAKHPHVPSESSNPAVVAFATQAAFVVPGKYGIGVGPALKSDGFPKKSQRIGVACGGLTGRPPRPEISVVKSIGPQNCELARVAIELISQPSIIWPKPFFPGIA